jgi:hypothetical protein
VKIPKRIFFFYSDYTLPWMRWLSLFSFRKLNLDWEMTLIVDAGGHQMAKHHGPEKVDGGGFRNDLASNASLKALNISTHCVSDPAGYTIPQASSVARWRMLEMYGGWFADTDILFVDSMDSITEQCSDTDFAFSATRWGADGLSLVGATKGGNLLCDLMKAAAVPDPRFHAAGSLALLRVAGVDERADDTARMKALTSRYPDHTITLMPSCTVYPWGVDQLHQIFDRDLEVPESFKAGVAGDRVVGIHWYGSSGRGNHWLKKVTADNWRQQPVNTFTHYARNLIDDTCD